MSKGGSKTRLPAGLDALSLIQAQAARKSAPGRNELFKQTLEALQTGGVKSRIPIIQQAVAASRGATSQALRGTESQLAARNIGGPFAASALAGIRQAGESESAQIGPRIAQQLIGQAPNIFNQIPGGSLATGSATTTSPDTLTPAVGAAGAVAAAAIVAI